MSSRTLPAQLQLRLDSHKFLFSTIKSNDSFHDLVQYSRDRLDLPKHKGLDCTNVASDVWYNSGLIALSTILAVCEGLLHAPE
jgi:hypothetical protein